MASIPLFNAESLEDSCGGSNLKETTMPSNKPGYQKEYIRNHYLLNKDYYKAKAVARKAEELPRRRAIVNRFKLAKGCIDCGFNSHPEALDFDHVVGVKCFNISHAVNGMRSWNLVKDEIRKCEVRCANCHRIATASRREL